MQEQHPTTVPQPVTQPSIAWSEQEFELLTKIASKRTKKADLLAAFPGRSLGAIRVKLVAERRRLGIRSINYDNLRQRNLETTILDRDDPGLLCDYPRRQRVAAEKANAAFIAALGIAA